MNYKFNLCVTARMGRCFCQKIFLILMLVLLTQNSYAQSVAVIPVQTIGFKVGRENLFYSSIVSNFIEIGSTVLDYQSIDKILTAYEYNLLDIVYRKNEEQKLAQLLNVETICFFSFIWNGEYTLIDVHTTNANTGQIIFQKYYMTNGDAEEISLYGIKEIINEINGVKISKSYFDKKESYTITESSYDIIRWAHSYNSSIIFFAVGAISKDKFDFTALFHNEIDVFNTYNSKLLEEYSDVKKKGEYVVYLHLGDHKQVGASINTIAREGPLYSYIKDILTFKNVVVVFYGSRREGAIIESYLSKEQRNRFWHRWIWE